jgi:hypothetical protein
MKGCNARDLAITLNQRYLKSSANDGRLQDRVFFHWEQAIATKLKRRLQIFDAEDKPWRLIAIRQKSC